MAEFPDCLGYVLNTVVDPDSLRVLEQSLSVPLPLLLLPGGSRPPVRPGTAVSPLEDRQQSRSHKLPAGEKRGGAGAQERGGAQALLGDAEGGGAPPGSRDARRRYHRRRRRVSSVPHVPVFTSLVEPQTSQPNGNIVAALRLEV